MTPEQVADFTWMIELRMSLEGTGRIAADDPRFVELAMKHCALMIEYMECSDAEYYRHPITQLTSEIKARQS